MQKITRNTLVWKPTVEGRPRSFDIEVIGNYSNGQSRNDLPVLVLGGMGERLGTAKRLVRYLGEKGVANSLSFRMPFEVLPPSEANLTRISIELPLAAAVFLGEMTGNAEVNMLARSQNAAPACMSRSQQPELFHKTGLIEPFGLTNRLLGETSKERVDELGRRMALNLKAGWRRNKSPLSLYELLATACTAYTKEVRKALSLSMLTAMSIDLSAEFREQVEAGARLRVFASKHDPVFPYNELVAVIGEDNITEVQGAHASSVSENGFRQLDIALGWLKMSSV